MLLVDRGSDVIVLLEMEVLQATFWGIEDCVFSL